MNIRSAGRDFVAIDVEYADSDQNICQVGMAVVRNLEIVERPSWLIQPPDNHYEERYIRVHHITPEMTEDAPTLEQAWPEIQPYLLMGELWAHNAVSAEMPALRKSLREYGIQAEWIDITDSMDVYQRPGHNGGNRLWQCCLAVGIPFDTTQYHDATYDAEKCAELVIAYKNGVRPDWTKVPSTEDGLRKSQQRKVTLQMGEFQEYNCRIEAAKAKMKNCKPATNKGLLDLFADDTGAPEGQQLTPEEEELLYHTDVMAVIASTSDDAEPMQVDVFDRGDKSPTEGHDRVDFSRLDTSEGNPLAGAKVVITGSFHIARKDIKAALERMGAKESSAVSKGTAAILIGERNVGLPKLAALDKLHHNGFIVPRIVGDADLDRFLYGGAGEFHVGQSEVPIKQLSMTAGHFRKHRHVLRYPQNTIAGRELYFPPTGLMGRMDCFCQICGNLGAFGNWEYCSDVNLVVLPDSSVAALEGGGKDDVIRGFEDYYNSQRSVVFDAEFITEHDILAFALERIVQCDDTVMASLYTSYLESAGLDPETDERYGLARRRNP